MWFYWNDKGILKFFKSAKKKHFLRIFFLPFALLNNLLHHSSCEEHQECYGLVFFLLGKADYEKLVFE